MNSSQSPSFEDNQRLQSVLKRTRELQEIVTASIPVISQEIPVGYTPARWQLALQSFSERLPFLKSRNLFPNSNGVVKEDEDPLFEIEFGPEWDLKCALKELDELLNKT